MKKILLAIILFMLAIPSYSYSQPRDPRQRGNTGQTARDPRGGRPVYSSQQPSDDFDFNMNRLPEGWCSLKEDKVRLTSFKGYLDVSVVLKDKQDASYYPGEESTNTSSISDITFSADVVLNIPSNFTIDATDSAIQNGVETDVTIYMKIFGEKIPPM